MLLSSSNRKYQPYLPIYLLLFPWWMPEMSVTSHFCHWLHLLSGKKRDVVFFIIVQFMMNTNNRIRFVLQIVFVCLYITPSDYHHCANLSEDIELTKCCQIYFVECVRLSILSQLSITQYMRLCVFRLPISLMMIEIIYALSYYHHPIVSMNYHPLFRVRSLNNDRRSMPIFFYSYSTVLYNQNGLY